MMRTFLFSFCCFAALATAQAAAQTADYATLSDQVDDIFDCLLVKPMLAQTSESSTRIGAVLRGVKIDRVSGRVVAHRITSPEEYCTPNIPLPAGAAANEPTAWAYAKGASLTFKAEITNIFNLGSIDATYIRASTLGFKEPRVYQLPTDKRRQSARDIKSRPDCADSLKAGMGKPDSIDYPIMITATCVGKLDIGFVFDRGIQLKALNAQIGALKVGLSAQLKETLGNEVECGKQTPSTASVPDAKPETASSSKEATADAAKILADLAEKALQEALNKAKLLLAEASKATTEEEKAKKTAEAKSANDKAAELKKKADQAKQDAQKAATAPVSAVGKCYDSARLTTTEPVVFGFQYKNVNSYLKK